MVHKVIVQKRAYNANITKFGPHLLCICIQLQRKLGSKGTNNT